MVKILHIFERTLLIDDGISSVSDYVSQKYGISSSEYYVTECAFGYRVNFRLRGGKGGFGRGIKQDGARRSKKLPPNKDSCRTLSGKRIGFIKAKRRVAELTEKIRRMEEQRAELKALRRRTNAQKDMEEIEMKQKEIHEAVHEAVKYSETQTEERTPSNPHADMLDFSILVDGSDE